MLQLNIKAPDFTLPDTKGDPFHIRQFADQKNVVLVFYPFDWSPVCSDQLALYSEMDTLFEKRDAVVIGISTDSFYCHAAFSDNRNLKMPLLSDFEPKGKVARMYDVYNEKKGRCSRGLYVLDKNQTIVWNYLSPDGENPGADGILDALDQYQSQY